MQPNTDYRKNIFNATFLVIIITLFSKISGLVRDQIMAGYFGISYETDAFTWAYFIPNLFRVLFAESIIIAAFIPVYTLYLKKGNSAEVNDFVSSVTNIFILVFTIISAFIFIFSTPIGTLLLKISGSNFDISSFSAMNRIMIFSLVVMSISGLLTSILNSHNKFTVPAAAPFVMNAVSIVFVVLLAKNISIASMAIGVMAGSILEVIIQMPQIRSTNLKYKFNINFKNKAVREIFGMMVPIMLSLGAVQINNGVDNFFALSLGPGNTTALSLSWRVANLPLGLFSVAIITVLYPHISRQAADENQKGLKESLSLGLREIGYMMIPASLGIIILANPIIKILFERYQFTSADTAKVSGILIFHSIGLLFFGILMILNRIFYSFRNVRTPLKVAIASIGVNFLLDWILIKFLNVGGVALSTSIVGAINVIVLLIILRKKLRYLGGRKIFLSYLKIIGASAIMCAIVYYLWKFLVAYFSSGTFMLLLLLAITIITGGAVYIILTYLFKMEEVKFASDTLKSRFKS
ncbi:MAG: murein biosynthesis integral membrane protein MurJ [Actinobacteria bacterium]|nr:murein biosynthesis integral membrane protein MurJ [Actinomycetota bacterium]